LVFERCDEIRCAHSGFRLRRARSMRSIKAAMTELAVNGARRTGAQNVL
jgi:hypothetical protein